MTTGAAKKEEKVEKRRALGRGLESLLPGPRVVAPRGDLVEGSGGGGETKVPRFARDDKSGAEVPVLEEMATGRTELALSLSKGVSAPHEPASYEPAPHDAHEPEVISIQAEAMPGNLVLDMDMDLIDENPYQTRYVFDSDAMRELRDSIKEQGVVQPVVVRPAEVEGRYILVLGDRRLRASKMAGNDTIPAIVRRLSLQQAAEMTVLENIVREDLNPLEQAEAFRVLSTEFKLTQFQIAQRVGVSRETVSNYMRLLRLPEKVMNYMLDGELSFSDAREILRLQKPEHIEMVAEEIVKKRLKWDEIEERIRKLNEPFYTAPGPAEAPKSRGARWQDPNVRAAQTEMERTLGMRVRIRDRNGKGRIVIEYANVDDYERVVEMLRGRKK